MRFARDTVQQLQRVIDSRESNVRNVNELIDFLRMRRRGTPCCSVRCFASSLWNTRMAERTLFPDEPNKKMGWQ